MPSEIVCIRRLTASDLGWFAVHRSAAASKQRALNINADIAQQLVSPKAWSVGGVDLVCRCVWPRAEHVQVRSLWKVGKNWRLGGPKLEGEVFGNVDKGDFVVLRAPFSNDGSHEVTITLVTAAYEPDAHSWISRQFGAKLSANMLSAESHSTLFGQLTEMCELSPARDAGEKSRIQTTPSAPATRVAKKVPFAPMPRDTEDGPAPIRTLRERIRSPHILSQMLKVSSDLSAEAHLEFMQVLELLAEQLRRALVASGMIRTVGRNHRQQWEAVRGQRIAFVDGGMANLSMLGATPVAARVGAYIVAPGVTGDDREKFVMVKHLIDELYTSIAGRGVYAGMFPDPSALRDAARICVEAAGGVQIVTQQRNVQYLFLHGALINPVSRYTDIMESGRVVARFPDFSAKAQEVLLPQSERGRSGRDANFVRVYLRQLELLRDSKTVVCGVVERESQATSVYKRLLDMAIGHPDVPPLLPKAPEDWVSWFVHTAEQFRITDVLLLRCVLQPGEYLVPVDIDRNELRRAPAAWLSDIQQYPKPWVSYLLPTEWGQPMRVEIFERDIERFDQLAQLVMHCAWLLPRYAFPVGLDIVDKYAKVPNWMARPINTNTAVRALRDALDAGDTTTFDAMRRMLCGSTRDWLLRPTLF